MKKFIRLSIVIVTLLAIVGTVVFLINSSKSEPTTYEVVSPSRLTIVNSSVASGSINPRDEVAIKPQISGIIAEVRAKAGQKVNVGDIIAVINVVPDMVQLNSAESRVKRASISLELITTRYNRTKDLYEAGVITIEEFESMENELLSAKEEMLDAENNLSIIEEGTLANSAKASHTHVRSTISGIILDIPVKVGNSVIQANTFNDGTTIATVANLSDMLFSGSISEMEIGKINEGDSSIVSVGPLNGEQLMGVIEYIAPKGENENGVTTFAIEASVTIPDSLFVRAGYSANAEVITLKKVDVLTIPERVIGFDSSGKIYIEILKTPKEDINNQQFEKLYITLGASDGMNSEVLTDIADDILIKGDQLTGKR